jgi:eukaryotic-like serine/threonine-protein kinase
MLTSGYQAEIGRGSFFGFWRTIRSVQVSDVTPAGGGSVLATLTYTNSSGGTSVERHRLDLVRSSGTYLIAGDRRA